MCEENMKRNGDVVVPWWWTRRRACPPGWSGSSRSGCLYRIPEWAAGCKVDQPASCSPSDTHLSGKKEPSDKKVTMTSIKRVWLLSLACCWSQSWGQTVPQVSKRSDGTEHSWKCFDAAGLWLELCENMLKQWRAEWSFVLVMLSV